MKTTSAYMDPYSFLSVVGDHGYPFTPMEMLEDCNGDYDYGPYAITSGLSWSSSNSSVATVSSGYVECMSLGTCNINFTYNAVYAYDGDYSCNPYYNNFSDYGQIRVNLAVSIDNSFLAVGKGYTVTVPVTLNPTPSQTSVILSISTISGTGVAQFASNNSTSLTISSSSNVVIKGVTESSTTTNMKLEAKVGNTVLATRNFTVVKVELSLRTSGTLSSDNAARNEYNTIFGTYNLGTIYSNSQGWSTGVEIVGTVTPSNFTGAITLDRQILTSKFWENTTNVLSETDVSDTSEAAFLDTDPQPNGKVYDEDGPSLSLANPIIGRVLRRRTNFTQWARIGNAHLSADFDWFCRLSVTYAGSGTWNLVNDVTGDNTAGTGITNTSINLQ